MGIKMKCPACDNYKDTSMHEYGCVQGGKMTRDSIEAAPSRMNPEEWKAWGTYMEDVVFCHEPCAHVIYNSGVETTLKEILDKVEEHEKVCTK